MKNIFLYISLLVIFLLSLPSYAEEKAVISSFAPAVPLKNYIPNAAVPTWENWRFQPNSKYSSEVFIPGANSIQPYFLRATDDPDKENLICQISTFQVSADADVWDSFDDLHVNPFTNNWPETDEPPFRELRLIMWVGDNGDYTFLGPWSFGGDSPCPYREIYPIPTVTQWGMIVLALFLTGSAFRALRRRKKAE